jgi:hypothetical protein
MSSFCKFHQAVYRAPIPGRQNTAGNKRFAARLAGRWNNQQQIINQQ